MWGFPDLQKFCTFHSSFSTSTMWTSLSYPATEVMWKRLRLSSQQPTNCPTGKCVHLDHPALANPSADSWWVSLAETGRKTAQLGPAKKPNLLICELVNDYYFKPLSFGGIFYAAKAEYIAIIWNMKEHKIFAMERSLTFFPFIAIFSEMILFQIR